MDEAAKEALIQKCLEDEAFRRRLLAAPKATIEQTLDRQLPAKPEIRVLQETNDTVYLVLPPVGAPGELSDRDLDVVAGGFEPGERGDHVIRNWS